MEKKYLKNGETFIVKLVYDIRWPEIQVFQVLNRRFFKKKKVATYLECIFAAQAKMEGIVDSNSPQYLGQLAEAALDSYLKAREEEINNRKLWEQQKQEFQREG